MSETSDYSMLPKVECDRCGFTFREGDLKLQDGSMVCDECFDEPEYKKHAEEDQ